MNDYQMAELKIALASRADGHNRPILEDRDRAILDIGCGVGQTFIAWRDVDGHQLCRRFCVGMDVDAAAIRSIIDANRGQFHGVLQGAEHIPYPDDTFDLVMSRVSLPYTDIPKVLREIRRVLKPGGRVWMTLHSRERALADLRAAKGIKATLQRAYVLANGYCLNWFGFLVPAGSKVESWQDTDWMIEQIERLGFKATSNTVDGHTVIEGRLLYGAAGTDNRTEAQKWRDDAW